MDTVHRVPSASNAVPRLGEAIAVYLTWLPKREDDRGNTARAYRQTLGRLRDGLGGEVTLREIGPAAFGEWFTAQWGQRSDSTWNAALSRVRAAVSYWRDQHWLDADFTQRLRPRRIERNTSRSMTRAEVERLLTGDHFPLRERLLWRMLYETAARSAEILSLNVEDLDMPSRRAPVQRKGGAVDVVIWQTGTARLLPRYLKGRTTGPLFLTERRARVELHPDDVDPVSGHARLSYQQAEAIFKQASGGRTLHQWRHSALTHDAERGTGAPMLMARSGHTSLRTLGQYARVSPDALARHQAENDPARRRG